jgi:hypothetical protein
VIPFLGHRDPAQPLAIDLAEEDLEQSVSLPRQGALTRLGMCPRYTASDVSHGDRAPRWSPWRPPTISSVGAAHAAVATNRQRGPLSTRRRVRLFEPVHHVLDLRDVAVRGHASAQARKHLAQRGAGPMDIVLPLQPRQHVPL